MISKIKNNYFTVITIFLIIYFSINFFGGDRGFFAFIEKREKLHKLELKEVELQNKINDLELKNVLLTETIDEDYIDILIREKLMLGKKGESTYIIVNNEN